MKKICRVLSSYLYFVLRNKSTLLSKVRLWKANDEIGKLKELDSKYNNYTHATINAEVLNLTKD